MCGVVGIHSPGQEAAPLATTALFALQHRGQESAGLAVTDGRGVMVYKDLGPGRPGARRSADCRRCAASWRSPIAVTRRRVRPIWENSQPTLRMGPRRTVGGGSQRQPGQHARASSRRSLAGGRASLARTDTELLTALLALEPADDLVEALAGACCRASQARYSLVVMDEGRVIGVRDPFGLPAARAGHAAGARRADRVLPRVHETAALDVLGAEYVR